MRLPRGACPEQNEILRYAQNDKKRRARNDSLELLNTLLIYAFDQSIGTKRPYFKTPIKGLYLVGASTFPGGGIEAVVISGIICANDICNWRLG